MSVYQFLRKVPLFTDLPDSDLDRLCEMVDEVLLPAGEDLFLEGAAGDRCYIVQSGELEIIKAAGNRSVLLDVRGAGDVLGEMALLEDAPRSATVRARTDSQLYAIGQEQFFHLLDTSATASRALLNIVLARWRSMSAALRQSEKMAQLGTLTAGLAHELNNPAAAVDRGSDQLSEVLGDYVEERLHLAALDLDANQREILDKLSQEIQESATQPGLFLDPLTRSDREYELEEWLEERDVPKAWELAPTLVNLGYDKKKLSELADKFEPEELAAVAGTLGATYEVYQLLAEIGQGASRISDIVKALKSYSYLDQAPVQAVDVHQGLDNTLLILRHKLTNIKVRREYAPDLQKIEAYGSELNQVWTNILDNAADALEGTADAEIRLRTFQQGDWVYVEIQDNGPGMPPEVQARVFEPFFTTKPPGKGTGLGLDTSYNVVINKHRGDIKVSSRPGRTIFRVCLPRNFDQPGMASPAPLVVPQNSDELMRAILENSKTVAVVGISSDPTRPGQTVPAFLQAHGYRIIPVNPNLDEVLGEKAYPDLLSVPEPIDVVQIFRSSDYVLPIVEQAIEKQAKVIWMQEGVVSEQAADLAQQSGLDVVMDACMRKVYLRLIGSEEK